MKILTAPFRKPSTFHHHFQFGSGLRELELLATNASVDDKLLTASNDCAW